MSHWNKILYNTYKAGLLNQVSVMLLLPYALQKLSCHVWGLVAINVLW